MLFRSYSSSYGDTFWAQGKCQIEYALAQVVCQNLPDWIAVWNVLHLVDSNSLSLCYGIVRTKAFKAIAVEWTNTLEVFIVFILVYFNVSSFWMNKSVDNFLVYNNSYSYPSSNSDVCNIFDVSNDYL